VAPVPEFAPIAHIQNDFTTKFGVPRQSGLVEEAQSLVVFLPEYQNPEALRGLEGFSHLWLLWHFHQAQREGWSPTVRPPRLGGNARMGVFATRSPYRPNPIGLSCVKLLGMEEGALRVAGADLVSGTPILDIKPYLPYADCRPEATGGFAPDGGDVLEVEAPPALLDRVPAEKRPALLSALARDPRPSYHRDPARVYGMAYGGLEVSFTVENGVLRIADIKKDG